MKVDVLLSPLNVDELHFTSKTTVVIDVLRATTTIVNALNSGAREVIPVSSVDFAMKLSGVAAGGQTLLCGERNTKMIEGFTLGNSPLEYTEEAVKGKSVVFFTTNGSKAIVKAKFSENLFIASFNNLSAICDHLIKLNQDFEILCAGSDGKFCIEDSACAGMIIKNISEKVSDLEITDAGKACVVLFDAFGQNINEMLRNCEHGKKLIENGFEDDIDLCSEVDNLEVIPVFNSGSIKLLKDENQNDKES